VVIPLRHELRYADDGRLDDLEGWTRALSPGGRLRALVDFGATSGDQTVSWVVDPALVDAVEGVARSTPEVQDVSRIRVRWVGHALEASFAITVDCDMTVSEGHRVAEEVRHRLLHEVARLDTAVIHVNPCGHDGADPHAELRHHDVPPVVAR
jgi:hypothetical protein